MPQSFPVNISVKHKQYIYIYIYKVTKKMFFAISIKNSKNNEFILGKASPLFTASPCCKDTQMNRVKHNVMITNTKNINTN